MRAGRQGFTLVEIMIVVSIIGVLAMIGMPFIARARNTAQENVCVSNLRQIDGAKHQWALENFQDSDAEPTELELAPYLKGGTSRCCCPADPNKSFGTSYSINPVKQDPACKILPEKHGDIFG